MTNTDAFRVDRPSAYVLRRSTWIQRQANQLGGAAYLPR
jgi:monofunctional biosynthetic peptidoglycan transglycosylase